MPSFLITGSSRGLGLELVKLIAEADNEAIIFATARSNGPALDAVVQSSNGRVRFVSLDVTKEYSIALAVATVEACLQGAGLDVLINNAAIHILEPHGASQMHALEETLQANVVGLHKVSMAFLPLLEAGQQKKLLNISSEVGSIANIELFVRGRFPSYKISKAAVNMLTAQYAMELKPKGFTVFCISPGWLKTDLGGPTADLDPVVGAKEVVRILQGATIEDSGHFKQIFVEGSGMYHGKDLPW